MSGGGNVFGQPQPGRAYAPRPCAYGVVFDGEGRVLVAREDTGELYLPGGGIEGSEDGPTALRREVLEELARKAQVGSCFGTALEYVEAGGWLKEAAFYHLELGESVPGCVAEHEETWLPIAEALARLNHLSHRWAVGKVRPARGPG